jgi:hypothetical protein
MQGQTGHDTLYIPDACRPAALSATGMSTEFLKKPEERP